MSSAFRTSTRSFPRIQLMSGMKKFRTSNAPVISSEDRKTLEMKMEIENISTVGTT